MKFLNLTCFITIALLVAISSCEKNIEQILETLSSDSDSCHREIDAEYLLLDQEQVAVPTDAQKLDKGISAFSKILNSASIDKPKNCQAKLAKKKTSTWLLAKLTNTSQRLSANPNSKPWLEKMAPTLNSFYQKVLMNQKARQLLKKNVSDVKILSDINAVEKATSAHTLATRSTAAIGPGIPAHLSKTERWQLGSVSAISLASFVVLIALLIVTGPFIPLIVIFATFAISFAINVYLQYKFRDKMIQ